jgi:hypothetical protein
MMFFAMKIQPFPSEPWHLCLNLGTPQGYANADANDQHILALKDEGPCGRMDVSQWIREHKIDFVCAEIWGNPIFSRNFPGP